VPNTKYPPISPESYPRSPTIQRHQPLLASILSRINNGCVAYQLVITSDKDASHVLNSTHCLSFTISNGTDAILSNYSFLLRRSSLWVCMRRTVPRPTAANSNKMSITVFYCPHLISFSPSILHIRHATHKDRSSMLRGPAVFPLIVDQATYRLEDIVRMVNGCLPPPLAHSE